MVNCNLGTVRQSGDRIYIHLHEAAIGKPRMTARDKWKQRPIVMAYRAFADRLRLVAGRLPPASSVRSVSVEVTFRPTDSRLKRATAGGIDLMGEIHRSTPDADNILKAIMDILWHRDEGIGIVYVSKFWGPVSELKIEIALEQ